MSLRDLNLTLWGGVFVMVSDDLAISHSVLIGLLLIVFLVVNSYAKVVA